MVHNNSPMTTGSLPERIEKDGEVLAIIIYADYRANGIAFFTPDEFSQQLAYMRHPAGKEIKAHVHNLVPRSITYTQEVLLVRSGKVKVNFYSAAGDYLESRVLGAGDVILLASGGHGFEMLEKTEMFEIKQGPYAGDNAKTRF